MYGGLTMRVSNSKQSFRKSKQILFMKACRLSSKTFSSFIFSLFFQ